MRISEREKRDVSLLAAIVLLGILLMFISGQFASRLLPRWSVPSDMGSKIDPNSAGAVVAQAGFAPLRPEILTPPAWQNSFLTPLADFGPLNEVPVVILAPATAGPTQAATATSQPQETQAPSATPISSTPTPFPTNTIVYVFPTWTFTAPPPTNVPPTSVPTETLVPSETPIPPTETPIPPTETPIPPTPTVVPIPPPPEVNMGPPDGNVYIIPQNGSVVFTVEPVISSGGNFDPDFVYYEQFLGNNGTGVAGIQMDCIIVELSADNIIWTTVLYWCDGDFDGNGDPDDDVPDWNTNLAGFTPETNNAPIPATSLYNGSGITIDIDSLGLSGNFPYIRFTEPGWGTADIDAIGTWP